VGGDFVLRVEDIDTSRCKPELETASLEDLRWLGLDWDEGPELGGPHAPYRQSERLDRYDDALEGLSLSGQVYPCTCSRAAVRAAQRAPHLQPGEEQPYPGTCRTHRFTEAGLDPDRGGYRLDVETLGEEARVRWSDGWAGAQTEDVRATSGDFLLGRPGAPTYQLAVVVDDAAMGITDVVRGRDLLGSTARQILLHERLGHAPPQHAHHPLLIDGAGRKLSKRDHALTLQSLREDGVSPTRVIAALAGAVGLVSADPTHLTAAGFAALVTERPPWRDGTWTDLR